MTAPVRLHSVYHDLEYRQENESTGARGMAGLGTSDAADRRVNSAVDPLAGTSSCYQYPGIFYR